MIDYQFSPLLVKLMLHFLSRDKDQYSLHSNVQKHHHASSIWHPSFRTILKDEFAISNLVTTVMEYMSKIGLFILLLKLHTTNTFSYHQHSRVKLLFLKYFFVIINSNWKILITENVKIDFRRSF